MLTSLKGIDTTGIFLTWIWIFFVGTGILNLVRCIQRYERPKTGALIAISTVIGPAVASLALFPLIHTFTSLPRDSFFLASTWQKEITSGILALRITSLILTYQIARTVVRFIPLRRQLIATRKGRGLSEDDVADFTTSVTLEERRLWQRNDLISLAFFQFSFYLAALTGMWLCAIVGIHTLLAALASWALLFIVDDWAVISDYCHRFGALPITSHAAKVFAVNMILLLAVPAALYPAQLGLIWAGLLLALIILSLFVCMFFLRARDFTVEGA